MQKLKMENIINGIISLELLIQKYKSLNFRYNFKGSMIIDYISIPLKFGYPTING